MVRFLGIQYLDWKILLHTKILNYIKLHSKYISKFKNIQLLERVVILFWTRFTNGLYRSALIAAVPWLHPAVGTWVLLLLLLQTQGRRPDHVLTQRDCDCALDPNLAHCYQVQCRRTHVRPDAVLQLLLLNLNPTAYRILFDALGTVTIRTEIVSCLCYSQNIYEEKRNFGVTRNTWDGIWNKIGCFSFNPFYEFKSCWQVDRFWPRIDR